ncbi:MAG: ParB/RepB/Spo0J family partition protein [Candidatus Omnitrophota bacterium]
MDRRALGKGLGALIPEKMWDKEKPHDKIVSIKINDIQSGKHQAREDFSSEALAELVSSIKEKGVVQPVLLRPQGAGYELIAGERRVRAAKALGLSEIPAIIREADDKTALEFSLIENLQRRDLNPMEEAKGYQYLIDDFGFSQEEVADALGKSRAVVSNTLRLLKLSKKIQEYLRIGKISMGHARALLAIEDQQEQLRLCEAIISKGLSVREIENFARKLAPIKRAAHPKKKDLHTQAAGEELQHILGTKVKIIQYKKRGHIQIEFYSLEDLNRILDILKSKK